MNEENTRLLAMIITAFVVGSTLALLYLKSITIKKAIHEELKYELINTKNELDK